MTTNRLKHTEPHWKFSLRTFDTCGPRYDKNYSMALTNRARLDVRPYHSVAFFGVDGSFRNLGIPNVADRLIQQAILQVLTPIFDPGFSESSFGFRPKRSAHGAIKQVQLHIRSGYRHCVDMDLSKFFDRVNHSVLHARVSRKVSDQRLLQRLQTLNWYLRGWCNYFSLVEIKTFYVTLDKWVRHRIRACYWKQWRKTGARARNLMNLGLSREYAVPLASSSRGPWFMSKCRSVERALNNDYLAKSGLVSLYEIWKATRS